MESSAHDIERQQSYFATIAQAITLLVENVNIQMEGEFADLMDRRMMSLYGAQPIKNKGLRMPAKLDAKMTDKADTSI